jgi:A1 cistron-splicing factor AAR2
MWCRSAIWDWTLTVDREVSAAEIHIQRKGLPELENRLQSYDLSSSRGPENQAIDHAAAADEWEHLTSCMKGSLLTKITGQEWNHWQVSSTHDVKTSDISTRSDEVLGFIFPKADRTFSMTSRGRVSLIPMLHVLFLSGGRGLERSQKFL